MKKFISVLLKTVTFFIVWAVIVAFLTIPAASTPAVWRFWAELLPLAAAAVITAVFWFIEKGKLSISIVKNPLRGTVIGLTTGALWLGASAAILLVTGTIKISGANEIPQFGLWVFSAFLNVIMQELLFRGYLYQLIKTKYNFAAAVIVTTLLFTAMHGGAFEAGFIPVLNVITMSIFVTMVLEYTKSLVAPIIIHGVWNIVGALVFGGVSLADDYPHLLNLVFSGSTILSGGSAKLEGSIVVLFLNVLLIGLFAFLTIKKQRKGHRHLSF